MQVEAGDIASVVRHTRTPIKFVNESLQKCN